MRYDKEDLQAALRVLRQGGIIVYPTDTVWGIGCDATNPEAVARIYALKKREDSKSMLVLLDSAAKLDYYVDVPETDKYKVVRLPISSTTYDKQGKLIALNIVSLSAFVEVTKLVSEDSLEKAVLQAAPKGTEDFNMEAVKIGRELAKTLK